jgi:hypothetical protein
VEQSQQMEQFSLAMVRVVAAAAGIDCYKPSVDHGSVDVVFAARLPRVEAQVKCTYRDLLKSDGLYYPLKRKNYDDLRLEGLVLPRYLFVAVVPQTTSDWLYASDEQLLLQRSIWWTSLEGQAEAKQTTVTVVLPRVNVLTPQALRRLLDSGETL